MSQNINLLFKSFVTDIVDVFPEYKDRLYKYYKEVLEGDGGDEENLNPKITEFLDNVNELSDKIANKDLTLFDTDPIILQNVSFKMMWKSDISSQTKSSIWKYLQSFCIIKINIESGDKINDIIKKLESKEKVNDKKTLKDMKKIKKLNEAFNIEELNKIIAEDPESVNSGLDEMDQLFKNTNIGKMAQEISEDLDIEGLMSGEGGGLENLLNGENMMNIIQKIGSKINMDENSQENSNLMDEAKNICDSMQSNPLFSSLMGMQGNLFSSMGQQVPKNENVKNINVNNKDHNPNVTKQRLQKKLQEKQKLNVEKVD